MSRMSRAARFRPAADYNAELDLAVRDINGTAALTRAYAACEELARSHYENFPVASRLLPAAMRPHIAAIYAFARVGDDLADEGAATAAERRARLDRWRRRLHDAVAAQEPDPGDREGLIVVALAHSIRSLDLPLALFDDLVSAF